MERTPIGGGGVLVVVFVVGLAGVVVVGLGVVYGSC